MRVVLLTVAEPNQVALSHKLAQVCSLAAIVVSRNRVGRSAKHRFRRLANRAAGRIVGRSFVNAWRGMQNRYGGQFSAWPDTEICSVDEVNAASTASVIARVRPSIALVSGTNLVRAPLISAAAGNIINLHTGVSPYVRGGPNCTNWCLAQGDFHLIGNTVMWLDIGIDSGPIIATERTPLSGIETLEELHLKVMEHAHDLYCRVVRQFEGATLPRIPQSQVGTGRTFLSAEWGAGAMLRAHRNFRRRFTPQTFGSATYQAACASVRLVPLCESAR